jgi:hypothetical protein
MKRSTVSSAASRRQQRKGRLIKTDYKEGRLESGEHGKIGRVRSRMDAVVAAMQESSGQPLSRGRPSSRV